MSREATVKNLNLKLIYTRRALLVKPRLTWKEEATASGIFPSSTSTAVEEAGKYIFHAATRPTITSPGIDLEASFSTWAEGCTPPRTSRYDSPDKERLRRVPKYDFRYSFGVPEYKKKPGVGRVSSCILLSSLYKPCQGIAAVWLMTHHARLAARLQGGFQDQDGGQGIERLAW